MDLSKFFNEEADMNLDHTSLDDIDFDLIETNLKQNEATSNAEAAKLVGDGDCDGCKI